MALSALSPLLCVTVCVLWVRSYWGSDFLTFWKMSPPSQPPGNLEINLITIPGRLRIEPLAQVYLADAYPPPLDRFAAGRVMSQ